MFTNSTSEQALLGKRFFLVLEIVAGGLTFYAATDYIRPISSSAGSSIGIEAILEDSPVVELDEGWGKAENEPPLVSFKLPITGLVKELAYRNVLRSGVVSTYLWVEGSDWDSKELLCAGRLEYSSSEGASGSLQIVVKQDLGEGGGTLPPLNDRVPQNELFLLDRAQPIPFVFGTSPNTSYPVTVKPYPFQALVFTGLDKDYVATLLIGKGYHSPSSVFLVCDDPALEADAAAVTLDYNDFANPSVSTLDILSSPIGTNSNDWGYSYYYHTKGEPLGFYLNTPIRGLGSLCQVLLAGSSALVDAARMSFYEGALNSYSVAGQIDEPTVCTDYIRDAITNLFPVTLMGGSSGLWVQPWKTNTQSSLAVLNINPSEGFGARASSVELDSSEVLNDITINAGYCRLRDLYTLKYSLTAARKATQSNQLVRKSRACAISKELYGLKELSSDSVIVYDVGTLGLILEQQVEAKALPRARVAYDLSVNDAWVRPGDYVQVYDAEVYLSGLFLVDKLTLSETGPTVGLISMKETPDSFEERASVISPF